MIKLTHVLNPEDIERYVTRALGGGPVIGRYEETWHILDADDNLPALVLFRHVTIGLENLYRLYRLLLTTRIHHGYLVYVSGEIPADVINVAQQIGSITLFDQRMVELILIRAVRNKGPL